MNSFYEYFAAQQKMAAFRQAKRLQRGVKLGYKQFGNGVNDTRFESAPIPIGTSDFSLELYMNSYGSNQSYPFAFNKRVYSVYAKGSIFLHNSNSYENGIYSILMEAPADGESNADSIYPSWQAPTADEKYLLTITRQGMTVKVYINGELKATKEQSEVKDLGDLQLAIANSSEVGFVRVWNYALSADDVTAHYNNGDPMGYVVPKASRYFEKSYQSNFTDGTDGWTGYGSSSGLLIESKEGILEISGDYANYQIRMPYPSAPKCASRYKMRVEFAEPVSISRYALYAFTGNSAFQENVTEPKTILDGVTPLDNNLSRYCYIYLYGITPNTVVRIKSVTIEPAGLLAEYLPQNLMASRKGPEIEPTADTFEFNIGSPYSMKVIAQQTYPFDCIYKVDYVVDEWDFQPSAYRLIGFYGESGASVVAGVSSWIRASDAKIGEVQSCFIKMPNEGNPSILLYGDQDRDITTARHLKVTINSITPVSVPISWLDSAKQLPLSDECMEPLFQSIGGYDMIANGAPEILYE